MLSPAETIAAALAAGDAARADLRARGIDPGTRPRQLAALEAATAGMLAASAFRGERVRVAPPLADVSLWQGHVRECRRRLADAGPDRPPMPPRLMSRRLIAELDRARAGR